MRVHQLPPISEGVGVQSRPVLGSNDNTHRLCHANSFVWPAVNHLVTQCTRVESVLVASYTCLERSAAARRRLQFVRSAYGHLIYSVNCSAKQFGTLLHNTLVFNNLQ